MSTTAGKRDALVASYRKDVIDELVAVCDHAPPHDILRDNFRAFLEQLFECYRLGEPLPSIDSRRRCDNCGARMIVVDDAVLMTSNPRRPITGYVADCPCCGRSDQ